MCDYINQKQKRLFLKNAVIIDGTGAERRQADILLENGKISRISTAGTSAAFTVGEGDQIINCNPDWIVSPGFIDVHSHGDFALFFDPAQKIKLFQGVTTEIEGNCGISAAPVNAGYLNELMIYASFLGSDKSITRAELEGFESFSSYLKAVSSLNLGINPGFLIGHGTLRMSVMGMEKRRPDREELAKMKTLLAEGMANGALGLSSGLIYPPGVFADCDELAELCKVVAEYDGVYSTHMRNESFRMPASVQETLDIGRRTKCRVHISHHKVTAKQRWGDTEVSLKMIEDANAQGLFVRADVYPYTASCTTLTCMIPPEFLEGGIADLLARLKNTGDRKRIEDRIFSDDQDWENPYRESGFEYILIIDGQKTPDAIGRTLAEYANLKGISGMDALFEILIENNCGVTCVEFCMDEKEVENVLSHSMTMIGSDSGVDCPGMKFHPRTSGTFPRVLGHYARERGIFTLEQAVRKISGMPAETFRLKEKGFIKEGYDADLVIFNHKTIIDKSDYYNAARPPEGIEYVILGGSIAVHANRHTGNTMGRVVGIKPLRA